ncbi:MAG: LamG-like jellyroll fold domain-containing protein [Pirellulaceae bacterium]
MKRVVCLFAASAVFLCAGIASAEISEGLVSYWPLDGSFVDVVGQNDGELQGSDLDPVFDPGRFGAGIRLDGIDQFVEIQGDESNFDFVDQDFSISAWFTVDAFDKSWQALIAKGEGNRWRVHRRGGEDIMTWNGGNADVPAYFPDDFGLNSASDGELHHFVGVSTADEVLMYIDGELVSVGPAPNIENNDMPVMIGENPDARGRTWAGLIDDVAIWGRGLDESEVSFLWNGGEGRVPTDPGDIPPIFIGGQSTIGARSYEGARSNEVFGEVGIASGFTGRIVTFAEHGLTIDNHTTAEEVLDDFEGVTSLEAYPVADLGGGGGTFGETQPYPNGVDDDSQNDFAVRLTANVTIPAGSWSIGFGSDDGGQVTLDGIEFDDFQNSDSFDDNQIRFEGNRGHAWTVGTFTTAEETEVTLVASFHERGGGDSFEIALLDEDILEDPNPANGWQLLGDGTYGWSVKTEAAPLLSADLTATATAARPLQFDVNGDSGEADTLAVENPDPSIYTTTLNVDGLTFQIAPTGSVASGEAFKIIDADVVTGTPTITSTDGKNWVFDSATGRVCLDSCPGAGNLGDFNNDGSVTTADLDVMVLGNAAFDVTGDGAADAADVSEMIVNLIGTWIGDSNGDGEFGTGDFVQVFTIGKFETGQAALWSEGDWNLDGQFNTSDFVAAFTEGGFEKGPRGGVAAVPEPASMAMLFVGMLGLLKFRRK